jgi:hypothetical protein
LHWLAWSAFHLHARLSVPLARSKPVKNQIERNANLKTNHRRLSGLIVAAGLCCVARIAASQTWQAITAPAQDWISVACSSNATKLVATAYSGQIFTSADYGATWTPGDSIRNWQAVASSADGVKLLAAVYGGQIYTSTNSGIDWKPHESNRNWAAMASSADGVRLVAGANNGQIYTSDDSGVTCLPRDNNRLWNGLASSADGSRLVSVAGDGFIYVSTNFGTN